MHTTTQLTAQAPLNSLILAPERLSTRARHEYRLRCAPEPTEADPIAHTAESDGADSDFTHSD